MQASALATKGVCGAITLYQKMISPLLSPCCRFSPSCSEYARQAVARYGIITGSRMAILRIFKCQPFHPGGFDPLP